MLTALRAAAVVEAASLLLLMVNLVTVHLAALTSLVGPVHGTAYLTVIATSVLVPTPGRARWRALVPGVGGLLALRAAGVPSTSRPPRRRTVGRVHRATTRPLPTVTPRSDILDPEEGQAQ